MQNKIAIIVAVANGGAIGRGGDLLYPISADLKRFKSQTMGNVIIMGRKTFESLPKGALPGRENVVITRNADYQAANVCVFTDLKSAIDAKTAEDKDVFIIGGGEIYRQSLQYATNLYITHIQADAAEADTFFPEIEPDEWQCVWQSESETDPKSGVTYIFADYERKRN
ncbi:MAG: dihydrofolate reductase [Muribaculaceae bacterium]